MKKYIYAIIACLMAITLTGCKSNQQKAEEFVKADIESGLTEFELNDKVYEPIKTIVRPAKNTGYNSKECRLMASDCVIASLGREEFELIKNQAFSSMESLKDWSLSKEYYNKACQKYDEACAKADSCNDEWFKRLYALRDTLLTLDDDKVIGFEILHFYKLKSKECISRYVVDKDFNLILKAEDASHDETSSSISVAYEQCYIVTSEEKYNVIKDDEDQFVYQSSTTYY